MITSLAPTLHIGSGCFGYDTHGNVLNIAMVIIIKICSAFFQKIVYGYQNLIISLLVCNDRFTTFYFYFFFVFVFVIIFIIIFIIMIFFLVWLIYNFWRWLSGGFLSLLDKSLNNMFFLFISFCFPIEFCMPSICVQVISFYRSSLATKRFPFPEFLESSLQVLIHLQILSGKRSFQNFGASTMIWFSFLCSL